MTLDLIHASPMPFGWGAPDSKNVAVTDENGAKKSPMPFGWGAPDSGLPKADAEIPRARHQCLSAGGLLTPSKLELFRRRPISSPMPFGWGAPDSRIRVSGCGAEAQIGVRSAVPFFR